MAQEEVFEKVKAIIVEQLGVDENAVTMEARFREDLEADSLDLVELIMAFEEGIRRRDRGRGGRGHHVCRGSGQVPDGQDVTRTRRPARRAHPGGRPVFQTVVSAPVHESQALVSRPDSLLFSHLCSILK